MENNFEILNDSYMDLIAVDTASATRPPVKPNNTVDFCCAANLPNNFKLAAMPKPTILYDLDNLFCKIEPKCSEGPSCCKRFDIRIVGSIPFIVNAIVNKEQNQCSTAAADCPIKISCACVVPVDKVVGNVCSYEAAIEACAFLELKLKSCSCVTVENLMANRCETQCKPNCAVVFTGKFKLPNCDKPKSVKCY